VQLPLAIRPLAVPDVTTQIGQFRGELATTVSLPADALPLSSVRIELSRSIAGTLLEGLDYLTGFPLWLCGTDDEPRPAQRGCGPRLQSVGVGNPAMNGRSATQD
jgi:hypothetical protein